MKKDDLKEKVSQLFISKTPDNIHQIKMFINEGIGGFMIGKGGNVVSKKQASLEGNNLESLQKFVELLNSLSKDDKKIPLFLAIDGEGGNDFNRLKSISNYKCPRFYGKKFEKDKDLDYFTKEVTVFADLINKIGFNINFAPLVDCAEKGYKGYLAGGRIVKKKITGLNKSEIEAPNRAYSDNLKTVVNLALTAMKIFQNHKIISTLKHFPSYGILDLDKNPHEHLFKSRLCRKEILKNIEPYKKAVKKNCYAIMKGHIVTCLDENYPASLSVKVEKFLRDNLDFKGLSVTDELNMGAVKEYYSGTNLEQTAVDAVKTNDILLISHPETFLPMRNSILKSAVKNKKILNKIDESYKRVLHYKKIIKLI